MEKIDFFGGVHGNYLELVINVFIHQVNYDISKPQFTKHGACHFKNSDLSYRPIIKSNHFSHLQIPFRTNDVVVRIVPTADDMLISITNTMLRAGNELVDINSLEKDTIAKLSTLSKSTNLLNTIKQDYGIRNNYPRSAIRNYFYSMLNDYESGLAMYLTFTPLEETQTYDFQFRSFFDVRHFYQELNKVAKFLNQDFLATIELSRLHAVFLQNNQGYHSELKCKHIWQAILQGDSIDIDLNLVEEAWIQCQVAKTFRCYDHPIFLQDQFPSNTLEISNAIFKWKAQTFFST